MPPTLIIEAVITTSSMPAGTSSSHWKRREPGSHGPDAERVLEGLVDKQHLWG